MADSTRQHRPWFEGASDPASPARFLEEMGLAADAEARRLGSPTVTVDLSFLVFLRRFSRFGYFRFGPLAIDVDLIQDIVERGLPRGPQAGHSALSDDMVRFTQAVIGEVQRSGRRRVDELHYLLAFMRWPEGLPARVFGELGVSPEEVEQFARGPELPQGDPEKLYSPEEAAEYLGVHVQTVRSWIRSGRLKASRLAGQRALRIRASALVSVLEPIDPKEA
ncbi:MAG: helix-turn-helix domain-containing protein [Dehalococcoidia bacterium]